MCWISVGGRWVDGELCDFWCIILAVHSMLSKRARFQLIPRRRIGMNLRCKKGILDFRGTIVDQNGGMLRT
jgi:hypothetical protein